MTTLTRTVALVLLTCVCRYTPPIAYEVRTHGTVSSEPSKNV